MHTFLIYCVSVPVSHHLSALNVHPVELVKCAICKKKKKKNVFKMFKT